MNFAASCQQHYSEPEPPCCWPVDGSIKIDNISFQHGESSKPSIQEVSFECRPGCRIALFEDNSETAIQCLFMLINRLRVPTVNSDGSKGAVVVGGVNANEIGSKCNWNHIDRSEEGDYVARLLSIYPDWDVKVEP